MAERYELMELLGTGGFGRVYLARFHGEAGFQKDVALKFLRSDSRGDLALIASLRDEARLLGILRHRSIVHVDRLIRLQGSWVIVMEYVSGQDLLNLVRQGPIPPGPSLEIISEVASALHAAFERTGPDGRRLRLTHRDIKPGNIRISGFGDVKVLDFGIARAEFAGSELADRRVVAGTPSYMAPERFDGVDGPAGDIYALGVVAYEMLTGSRFGPRCMGRAAHRARTKACVEALRGVPGLPAEAAELVAGMLHFEHTMRPQTEGVGRTSRRLALSCGESLSDWVGSTLRDFERRASPVDDADRPRSSILVEASAVEPQGGVPGDFEQTGHFIGQSLEPDDADSPATTRPDLDDAVMQAVAPTEGGAGTGDSPMARPVLAAVLVAAALVFAGLRFVASGDAPGALPDPVGPTAGAGAADPTPPAERTPTAAAGPSEASEVTPRGATPPAAASAPEDDPVPERAALPVAMPSEVAGPVEVVRAPVSGAQRDLDPARSATSTDAPGSPAPAAAAPPPAAPVQAPPEAPTSAVAVTGGAQWVELQGEAGRFGLPARVPAGTYAIRVAFEGEASEAQGTVSLEGGVSKTIDCDAFFRKCSVR